MTISDGIRIGSAGWTIPTPLKSCFGEGDSHLVRYATRFSAVEINSSFYRPHRPATYARWAESTPPDFRFSVKLPRRITHELQLRTTDVDIRSFLEGPHALGEKFRVLLVQLPPSLAFARDVVESFLTTLKTLTTAAIVCEPRHRSWFDSEAEDLLLHTAISRVAADPACVAAAARPAGDMSLVYYRLHGSPEVYYSNYAEAYLRGLTGEFRSHVVAGRECWCIFDNTATGAATANGLRLLELSSTSRQPPQKAT